MLSLEPPNSPDNLTILSVTSRTARVSWAISRAEPKIERFVVQWKKQHGNSSYSLTITDDMSGWAGLGSRNYYCEQGNIILEMMEDFSFHVNVKYNINNHYKGRVWVAQR